MPLHGPLPEKLEVADNELLNLRKNAPFLEVFAARHTFMDEVMDTSRHAKISIETNDAFLPTKLLIAELMAAYGRLITRKFRLV